jgi:hypothetical protein
MIKRVIMSSSAVKKKKIKDNDIVEVKKMRDYSKDPVFRKKAEDAAAFIKKHGLPDSFTKKK